MSDPQNILRLGWFSTGNGEGSRGLLLSTLTAIEHGRLNAVIEFVFCNRESGEDSGTDAFLQIVADHNIPIICLSSKGFAVERKSRFSKIRQQYDAEVVSRLSNFRATTCVLAGYMLIVSPLLCDKYQLLNLHPAKPSGPVGTWMEVIDHLIDDRATESGIMIHLATKDVDQGPVLSYCTFGIRNAESEHLWKNLDKVETESNQPELIEGVRDKIFTLVRSKQLLYERPFFVETLRAFADRRIDQGGNSTRAPLNLTAEVTESFRSDQSHSPGQ